MLDTGSEVPEPGGEKMETGGEMRDMGGKSLETGGGLMLETGDEMLETGGEQREQDARCRRREARYRDGKRKPKTGDDMGKRRGARNRQRETGFEASSKPGAIETLFGRRRPAMMHSNAPHRSVLGNPVVHVAGEK